MLTDFSSPGGRSAGPEHSEERRAAGAKWREAHREEKRAYDVTRREERRASNAKYRAAHPEKVRARDVARRTEHPEQTKAQGAVNRAIAAGHLTRGPCEHLSADCSDGVIHAHHHSYLEEHWLDVNWLCKTHHARHHAVLRRALEARS
jgi:hypothetical protein